MNNYGSTGHAFIHPRMRPSARGANAMGHSAYHHVGQDVEPTPTPTTRTPTTRTSDIRLAPLGWVVIGAAAFHGYRRNQSVFWAVMWALAAGVSPLITGGVALAQGFGKRKGG